MICVRKQKKTKLILILSKINPSLLASPILYVYVFLVFNVHDLSINVCHNSTIPVSTIIFNLFPFVHHYSHLLYSLLFSSLLFSCYIISPLHISHLPFSSVHFFYLANDFSICVLWADSSARWSS